jgi:hypothetical protein
MTLLPRLELTEDPEKNNDFIIFRHQNHMKHKSVTKKHRSKKTRLKKKSKSKKSKSKKSIFNIF